MPDIKFLIDADMPRSSSDVVRNLGFEVEDVRDIGMGSAKDNEIIEYAIKTNRIIITRDTDFGEVLRYPNHPGAIILRLPFTFTTQEINKRLEEFLSKFRADDLRNAIIAVELGRYRRRPLARGGT
jgi:predicted nuclease of predicted toxin-antitoxin system